MSGFHAEWKVQIREMEMQFQCVQCAYLGYCRRRKATLVSDAELSNPLWVRDLRAAASTYELAPADWREFLLDAYRDYPGWIRDETGAEVFLNTDVLEDENIRYFFRDFCRAPTPNVRCHIQKASWERVRTFGTVLRLLDPVSASLWGVRPANDN